jgi:hypothetical protein
VQANRGDRGCERSSGLGADITGHLVLVSCLLGNRQKARRQREPPLISSNFHLPSANAPENTYRSSPVSHPEQQHHAPIDKPPTSRFPTKRAGNPHIFAPCSGARLLCQAKMVVATIKCVFSCPRLDFASQTHRPSPDARALLLGPQNTSAQSLPAATVLRSLVFAMGARPQVGSH